jgi:hypothetical protein
VVSDVYCRYLSSIYAHKSEVRSAFVWRIISALGVRLRWGELSWVESQASNIGFRERYLKTYFNYLFQRTITRLFVRCSISYMGHIPSLVLKVNRQDRHNQHSLQIWPLFSLIFDVVLLILYVFWERIKWISARRSVFTWVTALY